LGLWFWFRLRILDNHFLIFPVSLFRILLIRNLLIRVLFLTAVGNVNDRRVYLYRIIWS